MKAGAPKENNNAEKWTLEKAQKIYEDALKLAKEGKKVETDTGSGKPDIEIIEFDFIGEVARELGLYRELFDYLKAKFPDLNDKHKQLITTLEANCFSHAKKGDIVPSLAIINLKSNHGWTDRVDNTSGGEPIKSVTLNLGDGEDPELNNDNDETQDAGDSGET